MRVLAIETSTKEGSIALLEEHAVLHEATLRSDQRAAQSLAPALDAALKQLQYPPTSVDLVAVSHGPGSFTGLRIAVTAAKTFAYAIGAELVALNTLRVLVEQLPLEVTDACPLINAQKKQLFAARYTRLPGHRWTEITSCQIVDQDAVTELLSPETVLTGPALARRSSQLLPAHPRAEPDCWTPRAMTVGHLGLHLYRAGHRDRVMDLQPQYYRRSYADWMNRES